MTKEKIVESMDGMDEQKVEYNNIKFGKLGNWFKGTLIDNSRKMKNVLSKTGEMQTVFVFKAKGGEFNDIVDRQVQVEVTEIKNGEEWSYITGKPAILKPMEKAKIGQIVGMRLAEIKKATQPGYDNTKIIKVYLGEMDTDYKPKSDGLEGFELDVKNF